MNLEDHVSSKIRQVQEAKSRTPESGGWDSKFLDPRKAAGEGEGKEVIQGTRSRR